MVFLKRRRSTWQRTSRVTELASCQSVHNDCDTQQVTSTELPTDCLVWAGGTCDIQAMRAGKAEA